MEDLDKLLEIDDDGTEVAQYDLNSVLASNPSLLEDSDGNADVPQHELASSLADMLPASVPKKRPRSPLPRGSITLALSGRSPAQKH